MAAVVPQEPAHAVKDGKGFVTRILIELILAGTDDRIARIPFPIRHTVAGACNSDLRMVGVAEPDIEHVVPVTAAENLSGRDLVLLSVLSAILRNRESGITGEKVVSCQGSPADAVGRNSCVNRG